MTGECFQLLADLRSLGVETADFMDGKLTAVRFFRPMAAPAPVPEDKPLPRPKRTLDERLYGPLGIAEGQPKPGGEG